MGLRDVVVGAASRLAYGASPEGGAATLPEVGPLVSLDGAPLDPATVEGKVVLFVNVASKCGLTPQYAGLVSLFRAYRDRGFVVVGAPCNQFLGQEPGSAEQIAEFCSVGYGVDFPLLEKQDVNGAGRSPLYRFLVGSEAGGGKDISWNFEKFVVGRDGRVAARFSPKTEPLAAEIAAAIDAALGA